MIDNSTVKLRTQAENACIEIYLSLHVSQIKDKSKQIKIAWSVGQELYCRNINDGEIR